MKKSNSTILKLVISIIFSKEKAEKLTETTKLKIKHKIYFFIWLFLIFIVYFLYNTFKENIQESIRQSIKKNEVIEFSKNESLNVLILPFRDANDLNSKFKIEQEIESELLSEKENNGLSLEIIVDKSNNSPKTFKEATEIGDSVNADFVIFGDLDSGNREYRINFVLTKHFYEFDLPFLIKEKYKSDYKKNLKSSTIHSINSLVNEKFIIYNVMGFSALKEGQCGKGIELLNKAINFSTSTKEYRINNKEKSYYGLYMSECYLEKFNFEMALDLLNTSILIDPDNSDARMSRVLLNFLNQDFTKTKTDIEYLKHLEFSDKNALYIINGIVKLAQNNINEAIKEFEISKNIDDKNSIPSFAELILNVFKGNFRENIDLSKKINIYFGIPNDYINIFNSYMYTMEGDIESTIKILDKIQKIDFNKKEKYLKQYINLASTMIDDDIDINKQIDSIYLKLTTTVPQNANENITNAMLLPIFIKSKRDFRMIKKNLKNIIKLNPDYAKHFNFAGLSKSKNIELRNSIKLYKDSLKLDKNNFQILSILSNNYKDLKLEPISSYYKNKALGISLLSLLYLDIDNIDNERLNKWRIKLNKTDSLINKGSKLGLDYYYRATSLFFLKQEKLSTYDFKKALKLGIPNNKKIYTYLRLGYNDYISNRFLESNDYLEKVIKLIPNNSIGYYSKVFNYEKMNNYSEALSSINKAIDNYGENDSIFNTPLSDLFIVKKRIEDKLKTTPNNQYKQ